MDPTDGLREIVLHAGMMEEALRLSDEAGWNQTPADWTIFMEQGQAYGILAQSRLVASAAILPFGSNFGWISMVLVTADWRRRGLASRLMTRCVQELRGRGMAALLDATPQGALVYGRLGFKTLTTMARWRGTGGGRVHGAAGKAERVGLLARDAEVFGGERAFLLRDFVDREGSFLVETDGDFAVGRRGRKATQIGPLIATDETAGRELLSAAIATAQGPVIVDLLAAGAALEPVLAQHGFEAFRTFERMLLDGDSLPGIPSQLLAAAGPEFG